MKVITLVENTSPRDDLTAEHGLSLYIETETHRILFDAGQSEAFARNAQKLGIDLSQVDFAVLSHGHYDHGGGLRYFLQHNAHAPIYMSSHAFAPHYNASGKYIGLDPALMSNSRIHFVSAQLSVCQGITLHTCENAGNRYPVNPFGLKRLENDRFVDDDFRHEIYMTVEENGKKILFSGCSHRGILNISERFQPDVCFGGFHLSKVDTTGDDAGILKHTAQTLLSSATVYYTGHCTGEKQFDFMKSIMRQQLHNIACGTQVNL